MKKKLSFQIFLIIILFYVFLLAIKLMGNAFKLFGTDFANYLISLTANPFIALFIGILATTAVQSSSVSTSVVVGLTASGALPVSNAIPIIMGANIGTTVTNTLVSLAHLTKKGEFRNAFEVATVHDFFNLLVMLILFPLELMFHFLENTATFFTSFFLGSSLQVEFTSPLSAIIKPVAAQIQQLLGNQAGILLLVSLAMLFISLRYLVTSLKPFAETEFKHLLNKHIFSKPITSFVFGVFLTIFAQSSSVTTSFIVPLAGVGMLTVERIFPYILGANIGTTFTAILAALVTGSPAAITIALVHLLFNLFGVIVVYPLRSIPIRLSKHLTTFALRSKVYPIAYTIIAFYIIPASIVFSFHFLL